MSLLKPLAWLAFFGVMAFDIYKVIDLKMQHMPGSVLSLEFMNKTEGLAQIQEWAGFWTDHWTTALHEARLNTRWDFVFIFGYVCVLIFVSYGQMQRESRPVVNNLLRLSFLLIILAGLLDCTENIILLGDMARYNVGHYYLSSFWVSLPKWILAGWVVLVWLFSLLTAPRQLPVIRPKP
jgi:hypothetical protein